MLCSSYSGETEETLACFGAAGDLGARRIVASTGGALVEAARAGEVPVIGLPGLLPAPRVGVAYMLVCAAEVAAAGGRRPKDGGGDRGGRGVPRAALGGAALAGGRGRGRARGCPADRLRGGPDRSGGAALEDPGQRERQAALILRRSPGGRPQRHLRLGRCPGDRGQGGGGDARGRRTSTRGSGAGSS